LLDAQACLIQFGKAVAFGGYQAVAARKIHWTRGAMRAPPFPDNDKKVIPISSIPHAPLPALPGFKNLDARRANSVAESFCHRVIHVRRFHPQLRRAAPGTGALQIITPEVVESRVRTFYVSIELCAGGEVRLGRASSRGTPTERTRCYTFVKLMDHLCRVKSA
jgi:hypothetical protein